MAEPSSVAVARRRLDEHAAVVDALREEGARFAAVVSEAIVAAYRAGGKVILFGNGGSAADAQHIAAELVGRFYLDRAPLAALALNVNTSALTAIANDYGYADVFARQLEALGAPGDVAIGLSTSGESVNVVQALAAARARDMVTVGLTGGRGGALLSTAEHCLRVPTSDTPRVQEAHLLVAHVICELVEAALFPGPEAMAPADWRTELETVFLDRDGTVNRKAPEGEYVTRWEDFAFLPRAPEAVARLNDAGLRVVMVTNQRGVAQGRMTDADLEEIHARMRTALAAAGAHLDGLELCPHDHDGCDCRKPRTGMFERAQASDPGIVFDRSAVVGDAPSDMEAARRLGARGVLVGPPRPEVGPVDHSERSLWEAVSWLLAGRAPAG